MITREFNLYLHAGHSIPLVINVNQYDHGEQWLFSLFNSDGTQYVPSSGAIVGIKSDNLGIINSGTVDSQGRVVINETQQMTAAVGKAVFELVIDDGTHGTANFVVLVEEKPGNNADLSETDISMIEEAIEAASSIKPYGSPLVASTVADMTDHEKVYVYVGSETGYTSGNWYYWDGSAWTSGGVYNSVAVQTDTTLTLSGVAADSKKVGDEISELKREITNLEAIPAEVKRAMDSLFTHMLTNDYDGSAELSTIHAWATANPVVSISVVYDASGATVYDTDDLDDLKQNLTVTATFADSSTAEVDGYTLSGSMEEGTQTFTVTYDGKTASFTADIAYDSTAKIETSGYYMYHIANADNTSPSSYGLQASTNAGITVKYDLNPPKQVGDYYRWCGILPTGAFSSKDFYKANGKVASLMNYDAQGNHVSYMNELGTSAFTRWLQNHSGTMTEYVYESSAGLTYGVDKIQWMVDIRYLDESYIYEGISGQVIFAGRNTPYFGMHNISEANE